MVRRFEPEETTLGLALVALGLLWTLANLGSIDLLPTLRTWWPLTLVVWGALELFNSLSARSERRP